MSLFAQELQHAGAGVGRSAWPNSGRLCADERRAARSLYGFGQPAPSAHALADDLADAGGARVLGRRRAASCGARSPLRSPTGCIQALDYALSWSHLDFAGATLVAANVLLFLLLRAARLPDGALHPGRFRHAEDGRPRRAALVPALERRRGGGIAGSGWNSAGRASSACCGSSSCSACRLWLLPPLWPLIPLVILAWVNQRLLRYDALAEHADAQEMARIFRERRGALLPARAAARAARAYVPFVGFFAPVLFGLAFIRYLLGALRSCARARIKRRRLSAL